MPFVTLAVLAALAIVFFGLVVWKLHSRRLTPAARGRVLGAWAAAQSHADVVRRIIEADKALDLALRLAGYSGSLGEKLKSAGARFSDLDAVWSAHKLRNRLAHEAHATVDAREADAAMRALKRGIEDLMGFRIDE
jgi:hypothetical protein